ncbi:uncharacterized protein LOC142469076 isoform X2 [Ascaphus truei]|uniref:uncharacterized protein LOC142469076 isoform X2 n=1 Tax=Ascaphus truei TaxID=8439 RepID=UPI003F59BFB8
MSYRVCNGFVSLPTRYGGYHHPVDTSGRSPRWVSKELGSSRHGTEISRPFCLSDLERNIEAAGHLEADLQGGQWRDYSRGTLSPRQADRARSVSPLRGIHSLECASKVPFDTEYTRNQSSPPISRRHSLSRLPTWAPEESGLEQPLSRRGWSGSEMDLRASLSESAQKRAGLVQQLRDAQGKLEGQSEELRKRDKEVELSRAKTELLALKQKQLETSISQLEKEKGWLEVSRYEDKRQRGELQDRIINLEIEVVKAKSSLENMNHSNVLTNLSRKSPTDNNELSRDLRTARENLLYFRNRVKVLEAEKNQAVEELRAMREGSQLAFSQTNEANQRVTDSLQAHHSLHEELADLRLGFNNTSLEKELLSSKAMRLEEKVSDLSLRLKAAQSDRERFLQEKLDLHRRTQELSLELERAQRGREGFNHQVSDLHIEMVGAKAQANRQDQEKVQMKEELVMLKQVNEKLTAELGQTQEQRQNALEQLHQLQAEQKISGNRMVALEAERAQLLGEKELLMSAVQEDERSQCEQMLRASQVQEETDALRARCRTLEGALEQAHEQLGSQIQEQQQVTLYWKERWQQAAVTLKSMEEQLEQASSQCQEAAAKNADLLQDCELLQVEAEEMSELRAAASSLKEENEQLRKQVTEGEQAARLWQLQRDIGSHVNANPEGLASQLGELCEELQQTHDRIKEQDRERSELTSEIRKLKRESGSVLRVELDACRQQLELERSRGQSLQSRVEELESRIRAEDGWNQGRSDNMGTQAPVSLQERSLPDEVMSEVENLQKQLENEREAKRQNEEQIWRLKEEVEDLKHKKPGEIKVTAMEASLEEVDSELVLVREELQKVWDMLKSKDTELEEQYQELESARGQYTECSTEKLRLEQLVTYLQERLAETEQTVRHLKQMGDMEKTEMEIERSSLELKLAEMQEQKENAVSRATGRAAQVGPRKGGQKGAEALTSSQKCTRCDNFLQQLETAIQGCSGRSVALQEEKSQALASLYQLQGVLKTKVNEQVAQALQVDNEALKKQHMLVTDQLKGLFKEKENLTRAYEKLPKEEKTTEEWGIQSRLVKNVLGAVKCHETRQGELEEERNRLRGDLRALHGEAPERDPDLKGLQRQLEEKSDTISTMALEMKVLQEKNDSLMKAKLRFQQQVQHIRSASHPDRDPAVPRLSSHPAVPRLSSHPVADPINSQPSTEAQLSTPGGSQDSSAPGSEAGAPIPSGSPSDGSWAASSPGSGSPTPVTTPLMKLNLPGSLGKSWRRPPESLSPSDSEGTGDTHLTHTHSALLSPRPYRPQKRAPAFRRGESQEHTASS